MCNTLLLKRLIISKQIPKNINKVNNPISRLLDFDIIKTAEEIKKEAPRKK